jgi:hypothetical protein
MNPRAPYRIGNQWCWTRSVHGDAQPTFRELVAPVLFDRLQGGELVGPVRYYHDETAALAALADAERRVGK